MNVQNCAATKAVTKQDTLKTLFAPMTNEDKHKIARYVQGDIKFAELSKQQVSCLHRVSNFVFKCKFNEQPKIKEAIRKFLAGDGTKSDKNNMHQGRTVAVSRVEAAVFQNESRGGRLTKPLSDKAVKEEEFDQKTVKYFKEEILDPLKHRGARPDQIHVIALKFMFGKEFEMSNCGLSKKDLEFVDSLSKILDEEKSKLAGKYIMDYLSKNHEEENNKAQPLKEKDNTIQDQIKKRPQINKPIMTTKENHSARAQLNQYANDKIKNVNVSHETPVNKKVDMRMIENKLEVMINTLMDKKCNPDAPMAFQQCLRSGDISLIKFYKEEIPNIERAVWDYLMFLINTLCPDDLEKCAHHVNKVHIRKKKRIKNPAIDKEKKDAFNLSDISNIQPSNAEFSVLSVPEVKGTSADNDRLPLSILKKFLRYLRDRYNVKTNDELLEKHYNKYFYQHGCDDIKDLSYDGLVKVSYSFNFEEIKYMCNIFLPEHELEKDDFASNQDCFYEFITELSRKTMMNMGAFLSYFDYARLKTRL